MRNIVENLEKEKRSIGVHSGPFHADEVTTCAFLIIFNLIDIDKIYRTRDPYVLGRCEYVCDVGEEYDPARKIFDHHQGDYTGSLSSAGMILKYLLDCDYLSGEEYHYYNEGFVIGVDAHDNGIEMHERGVMTFSHIIASYNPIDIGAAHGARDKSFREALDFALRTVRIMSSRYQYMQKCSLSIAEHMCEKGAALIFEKPLNWQEGFFDQGGREHPAKFIVMPCSDGHWKLRGIPPSLDDRMSVRRPLPKKWAGLSGSDLEAVTGIKGAVFCHKGRFVSIWETREAVMQALKYVLDENYE